MDDRYTFIKLMFFVFLMMACSNVEKEPSNVTVIRNAFIADGSGGPSYQADVYFTTNQIIAIDSLNEYDTEAILEIDAGDRMLTPGFIDLHAHGNPLLDKEKYKNFLAQGVTTICLGMDGFSDEDVGGWLESLKSARLPLNVVPFVGHSTLRELSGIGYEPLPEPGQIGAMLVLLSDAMKSGYFGLTLGLEYRPGGLAGEAELKALAKTVGDYDGLIMSHVRNEDDDDIEYSLNELINQGQFCRVHISHIKVVYGKGSVRAIEIRNQLDSARNDGIVLSADWYPYTASYTGIGILFPDWAKKPNDYEEVKSNRREELANYLELRVTKRNGPEATIFGTDPWVGLTLKQAAELANKSYLDFLIDDVGPSGASGAYFIMDEELQATLMLDSQTALASDGSPTMHHPRGYGSNSWMIEKIVLTDSRLSIEQAVRKMSGLPADILKTKDRGYIRVGYKPDFVLFNPLNIKENASFAEPHKLASGFDYVFLNGKMVLGKGEFSDGLYGKLLEK